MAVYDHSNSVELTLLMPVTIVVGLWQGPTSPN